jgi:hypothetical protein
MSLDRSHKSTDFMMNVLKNTGILRSGGCALKYSII